MRTCIDCKALKEDPPQEPIGPRSQRCVYHHHERRRWTENNRQRTLRARSKGKKPPASKPYRPTPLDDMAGLNRDRRIPAEDVGYLDDLANEARRHRVVIDNVLAAGGVPPREAVANLSREVGLLLDELNALLWPDAVDPPGVPQRLPFEPT